VIAFATATFAIGSIQGGGLPEELRLGCLAADVSRAAACAMVAGSVAQEAPGNERRRRKGLREARPAEGAAGGTAQATAAPGAAVAVDLANM
jgi:hypothetical protein